MPAAIAKCRSAGIKVVMVTGDHPVTAEAIARQIGLVDTAGVRVITGDRLQRMSATQLQLVLDAPEVIFARARVDQKRRIVAALQAKNHLVAVTGDGVNDAPALRQAELASPWVWSGPTSPGKLPNNPQTTTSPASWREWRKGAPSSPTSASSSATCSPATFPRSRRFWPTCCFPCRWPHHRPNSRDRSRHRHGAGAGARSGAS